MLVSVPAALWAVGCRCRLPGFVGRHYVLPSVPWGYRLLSSAAGRCFLPPGVAGCWRLLGGAAGCWRSVVLVGLASGSGRAAAVAWQFGRAATEGTLARRAKFQRSPSQVWAFGGTCLGFSDLASRNGIWALILAPKKASNASKSGECCHYTPSPPLLPIVHE